MRSLCLALALLGASSAISAPAVERSGSAVADALLASLEGLVLLKSLGLDEALRGAY